MRRFVLVLLLLIAFTSFTDARVFSSQAQSIAYDYSYTNESMEISPVTPVTIGEESYWVVTAVSPDGAIAGFVPVSMTDGTIATDEDTIEQAIKTEYLLREIDKLKDEKAWFLNQTMISNLESLSDSLRRERLDLTIYVKPNVSDSVTLATVNKAISILESFAYNDTSTLLTFINDVSATQSAQADFLSDPSYQAMLAFRLEADDVFSAVTKLHEDSDNYLDTVNAQLVPALTTYSQTDSSFDPNNIARADPPYTKSTFRSDILLPFQNSEATLDSRFSTIEDEVFIQSLVDGLQQRVKMKTLTESKQKLTTDVTTILQNSDVWNDSDSVEQLESLWPALQEDIDAMRFDKATEKVTEITALVERIDKAGQITYVEEEPDLLSELMLPMIVIIIVAIVGAVLLKYKDNLSGMLSPQYTEAEAPPWER